MRNKRRSSSGRTPRYNQLRSIPQSQRSQHIEAFMITKKKEIYETMRKTLKTKHDKVGAEIQALEERRRQLDREATRERSRGDGEARKEGNSPQNNGPTQSSSKLEY